jgi:hypothetical protein
LNNQVLHFANQGVTINEIHNIYEVPKGLQDAIGLELGRKRSAIDDLERAPNDASPVDGRSSSWTDR